MLVAGKFAWVPHVKLPVKYLWYSGKFTCARRQCACVLREVLAASKQVNSPVITGKLHVTQVKRARDLFTCELHVKLPAFAGNFARASFTVLKTSEVSDFTVFVYVFHFFEPLKAPFLHRKTQILIHVFILFIFNRINILVSQKTQFHEHFALGMSKLREMNFFEILTNLTWKMLNSQRSFWQPGSNFFGKTPLFFRYSGVNAANAINLQAKRR